MDNISFYFSPLEIEQISNNGLISVENSYTPNYFPELKKNDIAIIHVPEYRNSNYQKVATEKFRNQLSHLNLGTNWKNNIYDLGNILPGETISDTYFAVEKVVSELIKNQIIPIIVGGSQDLTMAIYKGYEKLEQLVNLCTIDSKLDLGLPDNEIHSEAYVSHLLMQRPCYLFNHSNIGLQIPFANKEELELFEKLYFDYCRLGEFNSDFKRAEPLLRNSDMLSIDITSLKYSELNDYQYSNPNGFYAEQLCQIARYAGVSDKLTCLGIFNYLPEQSNATNISALIAQIIWYFIDGINARVGDYPIGTRKNYKKFIVHLDDFKEELIFFKSDKSARWWMQVPYPASEGKKYERHYLVPCNYEDYEKAMNNEIPDLWWKTYQKLV